MTEIQRLKRELLREFSGSNNPVATASEAFEFLMSAEKQSLGSPAECARKKDGIYIVYQNGQYFEYRKDMLKTFAIDVTGVGVFYGGHAFQVALRDLGAWPLFRNDKDCPEESPFYKTECEGLHDWDFVSATEHIKEIGTDIPLPEGWYIPTLAVLEVMCFLKKEINEAIKFAGGEPMPDDYHWSSTEGGRNIARLVGFGYGVAYYYGKYNSYVVRPVAAFDIEA